MNSLAALKRRLTKGTEVTLVEYDLSFPHRYFGIPRKIEIVQTSGIMFEGGSWLYFPSAKIVKFYKDNPDKFGIWERGKIILVYVIGAKE